MVVVFFVFPLVIGIAERKNNTHRRSQDVFLFIPAPLYYGLVPPQYPPTRFISNPPTLHHSSIDLSLTACFLFFSFVSL